MKQALLVIDFIEGIAKGKGICAKFLEKNPSIISNTNKLIHLFREKQAPTFHIRLAFDSSYEGLPKHAPSRTALKENKRFLLDHSDTHFIPEIVMEGDDVILDKKYGDPFYKSGLLKHLQNQSIEEVVFTGVATDNAILFGANSAITYNFSTIVVTDAVGARTQEAHESALDIMKGRIVNRFMATDECLKSLSL